MKDVVKRAARIMSILTAIVTMSAWFAISNHCALSLAVPESKPAPDVCPFHSKQSVPAKQKQSSHSPCCKVLRAIAASPAKSLARAIGDLVDVDRIFTELIVFAPPKISFDSGTLDTGPPGRTTFAELIGSMRAHAPPSRV